MRRADQLSPPFSEGAAVRLKTEGPDVWLERIATTSASPYVAFQTAKADALKDQLALFTREDFDPLRTVIVDRDVLPSGPPGTAGAPSGETVVRKEIQGEGRYAVTLSREGLLVIPGHKAPGWRAWVDGRKTPVIEANIFSKGVVVPSGRHEIVLSYQPASFLWGAAASLISLGLCLGGVAVAPIRSRKRGRPASS